MRFETTEVTSKTRVGIRVLVSIIGTHNVRKNGGGGPGDPDYESMFFAHFTRGKGGTWRESVWGGWGSLGEMGRVFIYRI